MPTRYQIRIPNSVIVGPAHGTQEETNPESADLFRFSVIRVTFAQLLLTAVLATLVSLHTSDDEVAFSCALAASVNFVAALHYYFIMNAREKTCQSPTQDKVVHSLRYSDWFVTLPIMTIDVMWLASCATNGTEFHINSYWTAALMALVVLLGANSKLGQLNTRFSEVLFAVSSCCFFVVVFNITLPVANSFPISDSKRSADATASLLFTSVWVAYPAYEIVSRSGVVISYVDDFAFAVLDAVSKVGLALYVSWRSTWM